MLVQWLVRRTQVYPHRDRGYRKPWQPTRKPAGGPVFSEAGTLTVIVDFSDAKYLLTHEVAESYEQESPEDL